MTPWTAAYQAPPSMRFSRQEYWSGVPLPSPSQGYKYILIMIDTFTGWSEGIPTWTEKVEEGEKKKKNNCSVKSFQDLVCPGH